MIKSRNYKSSSSDKPCVVTRSGNIIKVWRDDGKSYSMSHNIAFDSVSKAKAFMNRPTF